MALITEDQVREAIRGLHEEAVGEATRHLNGLPFTLEKLRGLSRRVHRIDISSFPHRDRPMRGTVHDSVDIYGRRVWLTFHIQEDRRTTSEALHAAGAPTIVPAQLDESRRYGETGEV